VQREESSAKRDDVEQTNVQDLLIKVSLALETRFASNIVSTSSSRVFTE